MLKCGDKSKKVKVSNATMEDMKLKNLQPNLYETAMNIGLIFDAEVHQIFMSQAQNFKFVKCEALTCRLIFLKE